MPLITQNFSHCIEYATKSGLYEELEQLKCSAKEITATLELPEALKICDSSDDLEELQYLLNEIKERNIIILGIGGSSLGGQAIYRLQEFSNNNKRSNIYFFDNIDPESFDKILQIQKPFIIVISKSGETSETIMQLHFVIDIVPKSDILIISENKDSSLIKIAKKYSIKTLDHDPNIGGRFSIFSNVGIIPCILSGLNALQFRKSASMAFNLHQSDIATAAALNCLFFKHGFNINPLIIYSDKLNCLGDWFIQLWSESLGKNNMGATPLLCSGVTFQHSILQLFLDGPNDKFFTVLTISNQKQNKSILGDSLFKILQNDSEKVESLCAYNDSYEFFNISNTLNYMKGRNLADLFYSESHSVLESLATLKKPTRHIHMDMKPDNHEQIGELFAYFMLEVIVTAKLFNINPYDQPAVELVKKSTKEYMQKI